MKTTLLWGISIIFLVSLTNCKSGPSRAEQSKIDDIRADSIRNWRSDSAIAPVVAKDINLNTNTPKDKKLIKTAEAKFKVNNVLKTSEKIEDMTFHYGGYVTYSNLTNSQQNYMSNRISRDSILISKEIVVENNIILRVPNENLDSLVRWLNKYVVFLDYRTVKLDDVTYRYAANVKKSGTLQKYQQRQTKHIDSKESKLKETANAEESVLNSQLESDDLSIRNQELADQLNYCTLTIYMYQKPVIVRETIADFDNESNNRPSLISRLGNSIIQGWRILEEIIVFLVRIWSILLIIGGAILLAYTMDKRKKK